MILLHFIPGFILVLLLSINFLYQSQFLLFRYPLYPLSTILLSQITKWILIATSCIISGCLILVIFGDHTSTTYTVQDLMALYRK